MWDVIRPPRWIGVYGREGAREGVATAAAAERALPRKRRPPLCMIMHICTHPRKSTDTRIGSVEPVVVSVTSPTGPFHVSEPSHASNSGTHISATAAIVACRDYVRRHVVNYSRQVRCERNQ